MDRTPPLMPPGSSAPPDNLGARPPSDPGVPGEGRASKSHVRNVLVTLGLACLLGYGAWTVRERERASTRSAQARASAESNRVTPVLTTTVAQRDVPVWLEGLGNVAAFYTVAIKPQVDGPITRVLFKEGQRVTKGDVLFEIDPRPFSIQLESASAALARDEATLKNGRLNEQRYRTLRAQNLIPVQQLTDQEASVSQLDAQVRGDQAQVEAAKLNLDYTRIKSPIDGVVGVRLVDPGNVVHPADPNGLVVVTQLDPIAVFFTLPEDDLAAIHRAMAGGPLAVDALSRDGASSLGQGKLTVVDNEINPATATIRLKAIFDNPRDLLWPNEFVKARLQLTTRRGAITVPAAVVQHGPEGTFAWVVRDHLTAIVRPITVDGVEGDTAIVTSGLTPGEQVVIDGQAQLRAGARVSPKSATSSASAAAPLPLPSAAASSASASARRRAGGASP